MLADAGVGVSVRVGGVVRSAVFGVLVLLGGWERVVGQAVALTVERIVGRPAIGGTAPVEPVWSADSRRLAFLWNDRGMPGRDVWLVDRSGEGLRRLTVVGETGGVSEVRWTGAVEGQLVYLAGGDVWRIGLAGGTPERLTDDGGAKTELSTSPDGTTLSFLAGGDLWLLPRGGRPARVTHVGRPGIALVPLGIYNRPDVEVGPGVWGGDAPSYAWSPDGRYIALHLVDRRHVKVFSIPYYLGAEATLNRLRRGAPGDSNESRTVALYRVLDGTLQPLALSDPTAVKIVSFAWSPGGRLLIDRESDTSIDRWVHLADPVTGQVETIWHDHRESRVYNAIASAWHPDGRRVVLLGDLDDRYRLYLLAPGDSAPRPITPASSDVTGGPIGTADESVFFTANEPNAAERQVYRIDRLGGTAVRVSRRPGHHLPHPSPDGKTVALLSSDDVTPTELYLVGSDGQGPERRITTSPPPEFRGRRWVAPRYVTVRSRSGSLELHARVFEPPHLDRRKRHPVIFGPVYSNTVRNRWAGLYGLVQQLLVEQGYIVVQVDVHGSTGYGRDFREKFLMDWGGGDLDDLESVADYLATLPYVDRNRMGIWGSSYGGTLTVFSLFKKPGLFKAGVAGAPAVDPRFFGSDDVAIARTPATDPDAFTRGQAMPYAKNLSDHLLIIHGMADDVVPFQTTVALADELIRLGKDFDFAFAPAATHGWTARPEYATYLLRKLVGHFGRYLR